MSTDPIPEQLPILEIQAETDTDTVRAPDCKMLGLPYDLLFKLCSYLSPVDVSSQLSTCKAFHQHARDHSIWQRMSARFGLRDDATFPGLSSYTVFTQLLYPYGALLGLWTSDHEYVGSMMHFRLLSGDDHEDGGIVAEAWEFPEERSVDQMPTPPKYTRAFKICFDRHKNVAKDTPPSVRVLCGGIDAHPATLQVHAPSYQSYMYKDIDEETGETDFFPIADAPWYDAERELPHLKACTDTDGQPRRAPVSDVPVPSIYPATTRTLNPGSILLRCSVPRCTQFHRPKLNIRTIVKWPPQFFPMKSIVQKGIDPCDEEWSPEALVGLWLGRYSETTTQCLYLAWSPKKMKLYAFKTTGDSCVTRGSWAWTVRTRSRLDSVPAIARAHGLEPDIDRLFSGKEFVAIPEFTGLEILDIILKVRGPDELQVWWKSNDTVLVYTRLTSDMMRV
ncbi:uncharacterized protein LAESUDRAFT_683335 [Laetiporus sulphureus 93-53]|uniref:F-box domain-containing protein n=1 Tax=Laetiporus sulphureus 93-53 TaxID=1314785 RepID=A0A165CZ15_9APHY|nr:uncharacterized protein LAESUDRAFT_683335 [Laetiporus sulphureus 93-53]KZT03783.1 hypothetical protein LAESUDRAFT_683335 [Laetiporus sulphureus 93-53]